MCLVATILVFCGNQNVHLKFLNQNGRQFRLHYVRGAIDTAASRERMAQAWGQDVSLWGQLPP